MTVELAWYDGDTIVSPAQLAALFGRFRPDSLIVSYAHWLETRAYENDLASLDAREQLVVSGAVFEREINASGLEVFLTDYRAYLDTAKLCMAAIGQPLLVDLITRGDAICQAQPDDPDGLIALEDSYYDMGLDLADDLIRLATG